jgi:hypothetical protein
MVGIFGENTFTADASQPPTIKYIVESFEPFKRTKKAG